MAISRSHPFSHLPPRYWVTQLLAKTVGSSKEKALHKATTATRHDGAVAADALYVLPFTMSASGARGALLVNKTPQPMVVALQGVAGGAATVVEVPRGDDEAALSPPTEKVVGTDGTLSLGPFATAVVTTIVATEVVEAS